MSNSLKQLAATGAPELLCKAASLLEQCGWQPGITYNSSTGAFDVEGALCASAGTKPIDMVDGGALERLVPKARSAAVWVAWEALGWAVNDDPIRWQDARGRTAQQVITALRTAAERLRISVD
jgi:hypothetical protein